MDSSARLGPYEIKGFLTDVGLDDLYLGADTRRDTEVLLRVLTVVLDEEEIVERLRDRANRIRAIENEHLLALATIKKSDGAVLAIAPRPEGRALDHFLPEEGLLSRDIFDLSLALAGAVAALHGAELVHGYLHAGRVIVSHDRRLALLVIGPEEAERKLPARVAAFCAPEVHAGGEVDEQAEVFALGVLLHQIATGELPFAGETSEELAESIRNDVATPVTVARPDLPHELAMIIARCLKKDRELRYASSADVYKDLAELKKGIVEGKVTVGRRAAPGRGEPEDAPAAEPVTTAAARSRNVSLPLDWRWPAISAGTLLVGFVFGFVLRGGETAPVESPVRTLSRVTSAPGPEFFPRLSANGDRIFFARAEDADWGIYSQRLGDNQAVELTADSPYGDSQPALSPDGAQIAFRSERDGGGIFLMNADGSSVRQLANSGYNPSWSPDGSEIAVADVPVYDIPYTGIASAIVAFNTASGIKRPIEGASGLQPDWSPNGERIAYWNSRGTASSDIWTLPANGGEPVAVTDDSAVDWNPVWSPDGEWLYFVSNRSGSMDLWRVAMDESSGEVRGEPEIVTSSGTLSVFHPSFARSTGELVYVEAVRRREIYRVPFNASAGSVTGLPEPVPGLLRDAAAPDVSANGERIAFVRQVGAAWQVWVTDLDGDRSIQISAGNAVSRSPRLSPDGRNVAFLSDQSGSLQLWRASSGGGAQQQLTELTTRRVSQPVWSPDGSGIGMSVGGPMLPSYVLLFDANDAAESQVAETLLTTPSDRAFEPNSWSRDGARLAGSIRDGDGRLNGIAVLQRGAEQYERLTDFGSHPVWLRDGRRLLFQWGSSLYLLDSRSPEPRHLFSSMPDALGEAFSLSGDERWIYVSLERQEADAWKLQH